MALDVSSNSMIVQFYVLLTILVVIKLVSETLFQGLLLLSISLHMFDCIVL